MKISLEFAHTSLANIDELDIAKSIRMSRAVESHLRDLGHHVTSVVLIDDKKVDRDKSEVLAREFLDLVASLGYAPDEWLPESKLRKWLPDLEELLPPKRRRKLQRDATTYLQRYDSLPCSVDIAIWHAMRLGRFRTCPLDRCDVAISVLGDSNVEFEDLARSNILNYIDEGTLSGRIISLYYPESASVPIRESEQLTHLTRAMKEIPSCPAY